MRHNKDWFTRSAEQENQYAQYMLGKMYLEGRDVEKDRSQGLYWLNVSAQQGNQYAACLIERRNSIIPPSAFCSFGRMLYHLGRTFHEKSIPNYHPGGVVLDKKRIEELMRKREALGLKGTEFIYLQM